MSNVLIKIVPGVPIHVSQQAFYSEYPEFQKRIYEARHLCRNELDKINADCQSALSGADYDSDQLRDMIDQCNRLRDEAHKRLDKAIDLAHEELKVPYLVDCLSAFMTTGVAVYHNEAPLMPGVISDVLQASVSLKDKDANGNTDLVQVHYAHSVVIRKADFLRWGLDDTLGTLNAATWEAVTGPDYWLNRLNQNNESNLGWCCVHQNPYCRLYGEKSGVYEMVSEDCHQAECLSETEVNDQLRAWGVPLFGWE